jgi:hypothetical protein
MAGGRTLAKPHKHSGLRVIATTELADADIAMLATQAADSAKGSALGSTVRLEKAESGSLAFSVRGPGGLVEQMTFALDVVDDGSATKVQSTITRYKQSQSTVGGFIPTGPKKMLGLHAYRRWIKNFAEALQEADPGAQVDVNGQLTSSVSEWL